MAGEVKQVPLRLPIELLERVEQARGKIPRERWIRSAIRQALPAPVPCAHCARRIEHLYHWYEGCTCAAGGAYEEHSSHCDLYGRDLLHVDALIVKELP